MTWQRSPPGKGLSGPQVRPSMDLHPLGMLLCQNDLVALLAALLPYSGMLSGALWGSSWTWTTHSPALMEIPCAMTSSVTSWATGLCVLAKSSELCMRVELPWLSATKHKCQEKVIRSSELSGWDGAGSTCSCSFDAWRLSLRGRKEFVSSSSLLLPPYPQKGGWVLH